MNRIITYAVNKEDGLVVSRVGDEIAWPIIQFEQIEKNGNFNGPMDVKLENIPVLSVGTEWNCLQWTKKVPVTLKNLHRKHWGFDPLPVPEGEKMN